MIIPEDGCFPPITTSNLNSFNNTMVIKVANSENGGTTFQLATMNRSQGLRGWPADKYLNEFLPGHDECTSETKVTDMKKELNLLTDTSATMPKLFCKPGNIKPKFRRQKGKRKSLPANPRYNPANHDPWMENPWDAGDLNKSGPPQNGMLRPGLCGPCPVVPLAHNVPNMPPIPPRCNYPDFRDNREQNLHVRGPGDNHREENLHVRGPGHHYRGNYSNPGTRHNLTLESYSNYADTQRDNPSANFNYNNGYIGNEAKGRSHVSQNMNNRNFRGRFRNPPNNNFEHTQDGPSGYGNEALQDNNLNSYQTNRPWHKNKYNSNKKANNFRGNNQPAFRMKRMSYLPFGTPSNYLKPWASPMRVPNNFNKRNQRKRF